MIGYTWDTTSSMGNLKHFLEDVANNKSILHQLDIIEAFLQANLKHRVFVELDSRYV